MLEPNARVLFQGDSITDHGRARHDPHDLGSGYPLLVAAWYSARFPQQHVTFFNRGISGDRVDDLGRRWKNDCLDLSPTWVSILIGINDTWRRYDSDDPTGESAFETSYRRLLEQTDARLNARIILCEPFLLPVHDHQQHWRADLNPKLDIIRRLSREFNTLLLPLDNLFVDAAKKREPTYWLSDGVHTTPAGAALIAQAWLKAVNAL